MSAILTISAQELVHLPSIGDSKACTEYLDTLEDSLSKYVDDSKIRGYHLITINNDIDIQNHFIETDYNTITKGRFPFLYLFIQPIISYEELDDIIKTLHLVKL